MAVFAEAEEEEVVRVTGLVEARGDGGELGFVFVCGGGGVDLAAHAEDVAFGDVCRVDERLAGEAVVGVFVIGRDAALVAEGDLHLVPGQPGRLRHERIVDGARGAAASEAEAEEAVFFDGFAAPGEDETRPVLGEVGGVNNP